MRKNILYLAQIYHYDILHFFVLIQGSFCYNFSSFWRIVFNNFDSVVFLWWIFPAFVYLTIPFNLYFKRVIWLQIQLQIDSFFFQHIKNVILLPSDIYFFPDEKAVNIIIIIFHQFDYNEPRHYWGLLRFLDLWFDIFIKINKIFGSDFSKFCLEIIIESQEIAKMVQRCPIYH